MATSIGSLNPFSQSLITADRQLAAFFGDLDHKREVVNKYKVLGADVASFFDGKHMAWYVKRFAPDLIDYTDGMPEPSVKTIATIFEYHFHVTVGFRFGYLRWLPSKLQKAPMLEPDGSLPSAGYVRFAPEIDAASESGGVCTGLADSSRVEALSPQSFGIPFFPINQVNPVNSVGVPSTADKVYGWANYERVWRAYPELMGYDRQTSSETTGDFYPWFFTADTDAAGDGILEVLFPSDRSPFDNEENGTLGQLDGLSHWKFKGKKEGFYVGFRTMHSDVAFTASDRYRGTFHVEVVPWELRKRRTFVSF